MKTKTSNFLFYLIIYFFSSLSVFISTVNAQVNYNLIIDKNLTSYTAAEDLITIQKAIYSVEGLFLKPKPFNEDKWFKKAGGISYRFAKSVLIDIPIDHLLLLAQHEIYGHGARYREFDYINNHFHLSLPPPYSCGGGFAYWGDWKYDGYRITTNYENLAIYSSGMESNTVLAQAMIPKWLSKKSINYRESYFYFSNRHNITMYILTTNRCLNDGNCETNSGNDVINYLKYLNKINFKQNNPLTTNELSRYLLINILDPFQFYTIYAYFKTYLWEGNEKFDFPMIHINEVAYLPSFHLGLSPFGPEFYFENYFVKNNRVITGYFRKGDNRFNNFYGLGVQSFNLIMSNYFSINVKADIWNQPAMSLGGKSIKETGSGFGGLFTTTLLLKIFKNNHPVNFYTQIGYKSAGYLEGEMLDEGLILKIGLSFFEKDH